MWLYPMSFLMLLQDAGSLPAPFMAANSTFSVRGWPLPLILLARSDMNCSITHYAASPPWGNLVAHGMRPVVVRRTAGRPVTCALSRKTPPLLPAFTRCHPNLIYSLVASALLRIPSRSHLLGRIRRPLGDRIGNDFCQL